MCDFDLGTCLAAAAKNELQDWVLRYLTAGPWANIGLRDGLLLMPRFWLGPVLLPLDRMQRCCGPEPEMEYRMPVANWQERTGKIAGSLTRPEALPPLILECVGERLVVRDGNHRHGAMTLVGWSHCYAVIWCNGKADQLRAQGWIQQA
ncbi:MAG: hypothetical protein KGI75_02690 [Rhizobiaceae bacterium]|nr:hypothetical protein [Rhizobiaceae bacterium]